MFRGGFVDVGRRRIRFGGYVTEREQEPAHEARRGFDEIDRGLGATMFRLLRDWDEWVHRRVEQVSLEDVSTHIRRVSVDFTLPRDILPTRFAGDGRGIHFVPLTYLSKDPVTGFSIRDEWGAALPVLTRARNAALAASVLVVAVEVAVWDRNIDSKRPLPRLLEKDLWEVAAESPQNARPVLERLKAGELPNELPTDISADELQRERRWRSAIVGDTDVAAVADLLHENFILAVPLTDVPGRRRILKYTFETRGDQPHLALPPPFGWVVRAWVHAVTGAKPSREARYTPLLLWVSRAIGWSAKAIKIESPAVSYGGSYHLEVEAPQGLQITRARLQSGDRAETFLDVKETLQRVHLYAARQAAASPGAVAVIYLRSRPSTLVRTAWLNALFATLLLLAIASRWHSIVQQLGPAFSLLFVVPALVSAYVARPRELAVTTDVLFGLRVVAASTAVWQFGAAVVLLASTSCSSSASAICRGGSGTGPTLWTLVAASAITLMVLQTTLTMSMRPPEQREERRQDSSSSGPPTVAAEPEPTSPPSEGADGAAQGSRTNPPSQEATPAYVEPSARDNPPERLVDRLSRYCTIASSELLLSAIVVLASRLSARGPSRLSGH